MGHLRWICDSDNVNNNNNKLEKHAMVSDIWFPTICITYLGLNNMIK